MLTLPAIQDLFDRHGTAYYGGEAISQTEHALQCAQLAEQAGECDAVIVSALLHDVGHLMLAECMTADMRHQEVAAASLTPLFGDEVTLPVQLHVAAKRYLGAVEPDYLNTLSPASTQSLVLQGGAFTQEEAETFAAGKYASVAIRLRRYDDQAKVVGLRTPPLEHYMKIAQRCLRTG